MSCISCLTLPQLQFEADRALKLESDLARRSDDLKHEQLNRLNAENALLLANDKIKTEERASRDLQAIIDSLSYGADNYKDTHAKLLKEKSQLETRVKELETEVRLSVPPPVVTPAPRSRPRSSSLSNLRITSLEDELVQLRKSAGEVEPVKQKLAQTKEELIRAQNDKLAMERRMQGRVRELEAELEEREEEMEYLKGQCRESEARLEDLESRNTGSGDAEQLKKALAKAEKELNLERLRVADAEARHDGARREVEEARREVDQLSDLLRQSSEATEKAQCVLILAPFYLSLLIYVPGVPQDINSSRPLPPSHLMKQNASLLMFQLTLPIKALLRPSPDFSQPLTVYAPNEMTCAATCNSLKRRRDLLQTTGRRRHAQQRTRRSSECRR